MTPKTRKILFYFSILAFFLMGALVLSFALGFRYDFQTNRLIKTGSIVVKANVSAKIYIDDQLEGETSFFDSTFSKKNLLPGKYNLKVQKEGYHTWQKDVDVEEGLVSYFESVFLVKRELKEEVILSGEILEKHLKSQKPLPEAAASFNLPQKGVVDFSISSDGSSVVWVTSHEVWVSWNKDINYQPVRKAGEKKLVTRLSGSVKKVYWHKNGSHVFLRLGAEFLMLETDTRGGINTNTIYGNLGAKDIVWYDSDLDRIFKYQNSGLPAGQAGLPAGQAGLTAAEL
ncbi:MAG: carboxypeptidase regulatory-like domain-containing protein [Candidatus Yanofskybacteria bacterium]|nr:carboxypeptidase regulatory-like domain-containing protein [Candidatus Yanofskybacteria bacterium]